MGYKIQTAETPISLNIDIVWSESLLSAWTNAQAYLSLFGLQAILLVLIFKILFIIGMIKIMTLNNALCDYRIVFISLRNHVFKKLFRNAIRAPNSLDPDQVPYFVGPGLGPKCLLIRRYHEQS